MNKPDQFVSCHQCQELISVEAQFCRSCGAPSRRVVQARRQEVLNERKIVQRATWSVALVFVGTLVALIISAFLPLGDSYSWSRLFISTVVDVAVGLSAAWFLTKGIAHRCLLWPCRPNDFLIATGYAVAGMAVNFAYVGLLSRVFATDGSTETIPAANRLVFAIFVVVKAPLIEEWLCRGIMWDGMSKITTPTTTVVATAMLFAMLHFLGGGGVMELPHRFAFGLLLGLLRLKTNSLWPSIYAHFLNNLVAVIVMFS